VKARRGEEGDRRATVTYASIDIVAALAIAFVINAAILVMAGAAFHAHGQREVAELQDAHALLATMTGSAVAGTAFALALFASGQSSAVTATLTGQIVMEGFLQISIPAWARRLLTRAVAVTAWFGSAGANALLVFSQVVLSLQLPFAMVPLIRYTSRRSVMGRHANHPLATAVAATIAALIIALNAVLVWRTLF